MLSRMLAAVTKGKIGTSWTFRDGLSHWNQYFDRITAAAVTWNGSVYCVVGRWGRCATSPDGITWTLRQSLPSVIGTYTYSNAGMNGIAWGNSIFLTGGTEGRIATSPDGITWTRQTALNSTAWATSDIAIVNFVNSKFIISNISTLAVGISSDGVNWTVGTFNGMAGYCVAGNGTLYVAGGQFGRINTSTDGINWTSQSGLSSGAWGTTAAVTAIAWNGSVFCAVGASGQCATSTDGVTWTYQTGLSSTAWGSNGGALLVWNGSKFLVGGGAYMATSPNGVTWTYQAGSPLEIAGQNGIAVGAAGAFVLAGEGSSNGNYGLSHVYTSPDGVTWTSRDGLFKTDSVFNVPTSGRIYWDSTQYIALGSEGEISTSADGITWTYFNNLTTYSPYLSGTQMAKIGGTYITTQQERTKLQSSTDFVTWTNQPGLESIWGSSLSLDLVDQIVSSGSKLVAVGQSYTLYGVSWGAAATSTDGVTWTNQSGYHTASLSGNATCTLLVYQSSKFIAAMGDAALLYSSDGVTWSRSTGLQSLSGWGSSQQIYGFAWNGTTYCAVGNNGRCATSPDLITWTMRTQITSLPIGTGSLANVFWTGSFFVVGSPSSRMATSTDGITWTEVDSLYSNSLWQGVKYQGGARPSFATNGTNIVAIGQYGAAATSP